MKCILIIACLLAMEHEDTAPRGITISAPHETYSFGRDVPITVDYYNETEEMWSLPQPEQSTNVFVKYNTTGSGPHPRISYSLTRWTVSHWTRSDGSTTTLWGAPRPDRMNIPPDGSYQFTVPWERDYTGHLAPGRWTVWIRDSNAKLESNRLHITLVFTSDSIAACLVSARDKNVYVEKRRWHAEYLQKIMPDLHLRWWHIPPNEPEPQEQEKMEQEIQRELDRFEAFWKDAAKAPAIEAASAKINREAGLEPNDATGDDSITE